MTNFFIGLFRGIKYYPKANEIKDLGYQIFQIEPKINIISLGKEVNPDAISYSNKMSHTIIAEWTAHKSINEQTGNQFTNYMAVSFEDLSNAGLPRNALSLKSNLFVVVDEYKDKFVDFFYQKDTTNIMLCSLSTNETNETELKCCVGNLQDEKLSGIFKQGIKTRKLFMGYIPILKNDINTAFGKRVIITNISSLTRRNKNVEFTSNELCSKIFGLWKKYGPNERSQIVTKAHNVIREISNKSYFDGWFDRSNDTPPKWSISPPNGKNINMFLKLAEKYISEITDEPYQPDLFERYE